MLGVDGARIGRTCACVRRRGAGALVRRRRVGASARARLGDTGVSVIVSGRGRRLVHGRLLLRSVRLRRVRRRMEGSGRTRAVRRHDPFRRSATQVNGAGLLVVTPAAWEADRMAARRRGRRRRTAGAGLPVPVATEPAHGRLAARARFSRRVPLSESGVSQRAEDIDRMWSQLRQLGAPTEPSMEPSSERTLPTARPARLPSTPPHLDHPSPSMPLLPGCGASEQVS